MNLKELILQEKLKRQFKQIELATLLSTHFDFRNKIKRSLVQIKAAEILEAKINNSFCLYISKCLKHIGIVPIVTHHNRYYRHTDWLKKKCMTSK